MEYWMDEIIVDYPEKIVDYPEKYDADGYYYRVFRNNKWTTVCFSDLTEEEQDKILDTYSEESLKILCKGLAMSIRTTEVIYGNYINQMKE